jgi:hypothetical protein
LRNPSSSPGSIGSFTRIRQNDPTISVSDIKRRNKPVLRAGISWFGGKHLPIQEFGRSF